MAKYFCEIGELGCLMIIEYGVDECEPEGGVEGRVFDCAVGSASIAQKAYVILPSFFFACEEVFVWKRDGDAVASDKVVLNGGV